MKIRTMSSVINLNNYDKLEIKRLWLSNVWAINAVKRTSKRRTLRGVIILLSQYEDAKKLVKVITDAWENGDVWFNLEDVDMMLVKMKPVVFEFNQ